MRKDCGLTLTRVQASAPHGQWLPAAFTPHSAPTLGLDTRMSGHEPQAGLPPGSGPDERAEALPASRGAPARSSPTFSDSARASPDAGAGAGGGVSDDADGAGAGGDGGRGGQRRRAGRGGYPAKAAATSAHAPSAKRGRWHPCDSIRVRLAALVMVGLAFHGLMLFAVFDSYFLSPVVHGMTAVAPEDARAPADRLVLFVADGLRADTFFEVVARSPENPQGSRAKFLRSVTQQRGPWGVSHTHVPTESRPGHVALVAGFYEDTSAVFEGWKANPVPYDSVFNASDHSYCFGSPDIVRLFESLPNTEVFHYAPEDEDFSRDSSRLDKWVFNHVAQLFEKAKEDEELRAQLARPRQVFFLHLLGIDSNGHAYKPSSEEYQNNVRSVDMGVRAVFSLFEREFPDHRTAYVFTSDHGMSDRGSHGDGDPANTRTPFVGWGAGFRGPRRTQDPIVELAPAAPRGGWDHAAEVEVTREWELHSTVRHDVHQADLAPLMSALIGVPVPRNSEGVLPIDYMRPNRYRIRAFRANIAQMVNQVRRKAELRRARAIWYRPFPGMKRLEDLLEKVDHLIETFPDMERHDARDGAKYFQKYDCSFIMTCAVGGFTGWLAIQALFVTFHYTPLGARRQRRSGLSWTLRWVLLDAAVCLYLWLEQSSWRYLAYASLPIAFWATVISYPAVVLVWVKQLGLAPPRSAQRGGARGASGAAPGPATPLTVPPAVKRLLVAWIWLEFIVVGYFYRAAFSVLLLALAVWPWLRFSNGARVPAAVRATWSVVCLGLAVFPTLPVNMGSHPWAVVSGAALVVVVGGLSDLVQRRGAAPEGYRSPKWLVPCQLLLVAAAAALVWHTTAALAQKDGLPLVNQVLAWTLALGAPFLTAFSGRGWPARLTSFNAGIAVPYTLLSVSYEVLFYAGLSALLLLWIRTESTGGAWSYARLASEEGATVLPTAVRGSGSAAGSGEDDEDDEADEAAALLREGATPRERGLLRARAAQSRAAALRRARVAEAQRLGLAAGGAEVHGRVVLDDVRVVLAFATLLLLTFFGTGNMASISSFELSSTYRFVTVFAPHLMGVLLVTKILLPWLSVCLALVLLCRATGKPVSGLFVLLLAAFDVLALNFFFLVRDEGSWQDIGVSISHFCIASFSAALFPGAFGVALLTAPSRARSNLKSPRSLTPDDGGRGSGSAAGSAVPDGKAKQGTPAGKAKQGTPAGGGDGR